jgi:hypothetical protein
MSKDGDWKSNYHLIQEVFEKFLKEEAKTPEKLAYDRPS